MSNTGLIEIVAAGCYGVELDKTEGDLGEIELTLREDTQVIDHYGSHLYLPALSAVTRDGDVYTLDDGVLWVAGDGDSDRATIHVRVGEYLLQGIGADFSVEKTRGARPRLYVEQGEVLATREDKSESESVKAGQTLALDGERPQPVDLTPGAGQLLRKIAGPVVTFELAPSPAEVFENRLTQIIVMLAQGSMLLAYLITFIVVPALILGSAIYYVRQWRSTGRQGKTRMSHNRP
jgi:hypothetical protein